MDRYRPKLADHLSTSCPDFRGSVDAFMNYRICPFTQNHLHSRKQMQAYPTPLPPAGILVSFQGSIQPIVEQLKTLTFANLKLRAARDVLLPRLMSGELAV
jgi:hypothetical protein